MTWLERFKVGKKLHKLQAQAIVHSLVARIDRHPPQGGTLYALTRPGIEFSWDVQTGGWHQPTVWVWHQRDELRLLLGLGNWPYELLEKTQPPDVVLSASLDRWPAVFEMADKMLVADDARRRLGA